MLIKRKYKIITQLECCNENSFVRMETVCDLCYNNKGITRGYDFLFSPFYIQLECEQKCIIINTGTLGIEHSVCLFSEIYV